jgi:hypothetical protein
MKTRQLITMFILLVGFTMLREIERRIWVHAESVIDQVATSFQFNEPTNSPTTTTALLTTQMKNK